jgi:hypothetical protein
MSNADSFFGGGPQLSWAITKPDGSWERDQTMLGVIRGGVIVKEPDIRQMTKLGTGEPLFWDDAKTQPKMQMIVTLRCDGTAQATLPNGTVVTARDERTGPTDNGDRQLYINSQEMKNAIKTAFSAAGAEGLRVGSILLIAMTGTRPSKIKGGYPASTFASVYVPGQVSIPDRHNPTGQNPFDAAAPAQQMTQQVVQQPAQPAVPMQQSAPAQFPQQAPAQPAAGADNPFGGPSQVPATVAPLQGANPFA